MVRKLTVKEVIQRKDSGQRLVMVTAFDYTSGFFAQQAEVDIILVGDSLGMTVLGYDSTIPVTMEEMIHHTKAARRGAPATMCVADLTFLSYEVSTEEAVRNGGRLIKEAGADAVKLEGGGQRAETVVALARAGIPVMGHLGLTPQTASQLGGYKVQGRDPEEAAKIYHDALALQEAGAIALVLECVPKELAKRITDSLTIPTIGIGAGKNCDGQVLVFHDLVGLYERIKPKFAKQYVSLSGEIKKALCQYKEEVRSGQFPAEEHSF